jgi:hypothetical protein
MSHEQSAGLNHEIRSLINPLNSGKVQIFGNKTEK